MLDRAIAQQKNDKNFVFAHIYQDFAYTFNMKELKRNLIIGTLFVLVTGTLAHFVYGWSGQNWIVGFFFPVSESTWEHMKLCYFPMLIYALFTRRRLKDTFPCINSALPAGILAGTFAIPVLFYTYTGILGKNDLPLDIGVFLVSVLIGFYVIYRLTVTCKVRHDTVVLWFAVIVLGLFFVLFTYFPPMLPLFVTIHTSSS